MHTALHIKPNTETAVFRPDQVAWAFVALGIVLRLTRYLLHFPLFPDETFLAVHFLDRDYLDLWRPLEHEQFAPLLFLWIECTIVRWLGFSEWTLRLVPMLCGMGSVLLFRALAARFWQGWAYAFSVAIFAVSYFLIRHSAEAKPYAGDLLIAMLLIWLALDWLSAPQRTRPLWLTALVAPLCLGMSFPSVFVIGAMGLAILPSVGRQRRLSVWLACGACILTVTSMAAFLYITHLRPQFAASGPGMVETYWQSGFPPWRHPGQLLIWIADQHSSLMMAYPLGSKRAGSAATLLLCLAAVIVLWRQRQRQTIALLLAPFGMGLIAALLGRYPYGASARTMQYVAPAICLMAGLGLATLINLIRGQVHQRRAWVGGVAVLWCIGSGILAADLSYSYKDPTDEVSRDFARWFWPSHTQGAEVACAERDLGLNTGAIGQSFPNRPEYFCNQRIYSTCGRGLPPRWESISESRPLRVVLSKVDWDSRNNEALQNWLAELQAAHQLRLVSVDRHRVNLGASASQGRMIDVFEFVPQNCAQAQRVIAPVLLR